MRPDVFVLLEQRILKARMCVEGQRKIAARDLATFRSELLQTMERSLAALEEQRDLFVRFPKLPASGGTG